MIEIGSLRYGVIFKKGFCDPEIFSAFVQDLVGVTLEIDEVETEKSFSPPIGNVDSRFDLFAVDQKNRVIVDIQHVRLGDHYHRFLHYHCAAMLEMVNSSKDYRPPLQVYTIVVLTSGDKHKRDVSLIDFDPKDLEGKPLGEINHRIVFICPKYRNEKTPKRYQEWMKAIDESLNEVVEESDYSRSEILKLFRHIKKDLISPQEYAKMKDEYSYQKHNEETYKKGEEKGIIKVTSNLLRLRFKQEAEVRIPQLEEYTEDSLEKIGERLLSEASLETIFAGLEKKTYS